MNETADYKKYVMRQMGLQEAQFVPLPKKEAIEPQISPTARPPTILALGIRGSTTGGLPSGADQQGDISPTKVGGYDRVQPKNLNSKLVDKTPDNPEIHQSNPINDNPSTEAGVTHPHQIQVTAHEEPQSVTGASTDSDPTLTLKSASPKGIEVDIPGENQEPEQAVHDEDDHTAMIPATSLSETFARHRKLMLEKLGLCSCGCKPSECTCKPDCKCGCNKKVEECATCGCGDPTDTHDYEEEEKTLDEIKDFSNRSDDEVPEWVRQHRERNRKIQSDRQRWEAQNKKDSDKKKETDSEKVNEQQRLDESYATPFQRMRSLAGVGNMILTSNGLFENKNDPGASKPFNTHWKMDKKKAGFVKIDEDKLKQVKASLERKSKRGTLSDKEMELVKRMDEVLKRRQLSEGQGGKCRIKGCGGQVKSPPETRAGLGGLCAKHVASQQDQEHASGEHSKMINWIHTGKHEFPK